MLMVLNMQEYAPSISILEFESTVRFEKKNILSSAESVADLQ